MWYRKQPFRTRGRGENPCQPCFRRGEHWPPVRPIDSVRVRTGRTRAGGRPPAKRLGSLPTGLGPATGPVEPDSRRLHAVAIRLRAVPIARTNRRAGPIASTSRHGSQVVNGYRSHLLRCRRTRAARMSSRRRGGATTTCGEDRRCRLLHVARPARRPESAAGLGDLIEKRPGYRRLQATEEWPPRSKNLPEHLSQTGTRRRESPGCEERPDQCSESGVAKTLLWEITVARATSIQHLRVLMAPCVKRCDGAGYGLGDHPFGVTLDLQAASFRGRYLTAACGT
jgi:hypothetical protein